MLANPTNQYDHAIPDIAGDSPRGVLGSLALAWSLITCSKLRALQRSVGAFIDHVSRDRMDISKAVGPFESSELLQSDQMGYLAFLCVTALCFRLSTAHFLLNYPPTIGFDDSLEATPPCGSFKVDFSSDNVSDFHVGGNALAMTSIHPQATWLFRATLDRTASGNWTVLLPPILQTGLGDYCERDVTVPASFAGSKGVIQVVQDAPDGILYQCAAVNFVAGSAAPPSICTNVTGLTAAYTSDAALSSLPASAAATSTASAAGSPTMSGTMNSTTASSLASATVGSSLGYTYVVWALMAAFGSVVVWIL